MTDLGQHSYAMKLLACLFLAMLGNGMAKAQILHGMVRTISRPNKPGTPLGNVTVKLRGLNNAVVTSSSGAFQIECPGMKEGDPIILQQVQKKGYILKDEDLVGRPLAFSTKATLEIVMVSIEQLEADKKRIEDKAYKRAESNYRKKVEQLDKKKKQNELTAEKYSIELQKLQSKYERYLSLIENMAERYANTDYGLQDSINCEINICIENGELEKADSLIHTVFDYETVLEKNHAAKEEVRQRMAFAQSVIDKAHDDMEAIKRDLEYARRIVELCGILADAYMEQGKKDKALACLEKELDIMRILYVENSEETRQLIKRINLLKQ